MHIFVQTQINTPLLDNYLTRLYKERFTQFPIKMFNDCADLINLMPEIVKTENLLMASQLSFNLHNKIFFKISHLKTSFHSLLLCILVYKCMHARIHSNIHNVCEVIHKNISTMKLQHVLNNMHK